MSLRESTARGSPRVRELTPRGSGGVSVLELAGEGARELFARHVAGAALVPGALALVHLSLGGEELDEALVWCESDARLELHLHGSPPLVRRVEAELLRAGFELAQSSGPRSLEERASSLLSAARAPAAARMLLDQSEGALRAELARCARLSGPELALALERLREHARQARFLLDPARVVLAGIVNAGKSTLFNALVGSERALVSAEPGTTRDVVCEPALLGDWPVLLFDTAGERALERRDAAARVEAGGQELGRQARASAELVLWLSPADAQSPPPPAGALALTTRADLAGPAAIRAGPALAAGPDPRGAAALVARVVREALALPERAWEPGAGVPFEPWMEPVLARAARERDASILEELARPR